MTPKSRTLEALANERNVTADSLLAKIRFILKQNKPKKRYLSLIDGTSDVEFEVDCKSIGIIKNKYGSFYEYYFQINDNWIDYSVLIMTENYDENHMPIFKQQDYLLTKFNSQCESQTLFGDKTCDCAEQLALSLQLIAQRGEGMVIHVTRQEGRGKGLESKLDQLAICELLDVDTVTGSLIRAELVEKLDTTKMGIQEAIDSRDFLGCVALLKYFGAPNHICLIMQTTTPSKSLPLTINGYSCEIYKIQTEPTSSNRTHIEAKRKYFG
ncbi:hypothetical protein OQZ33_17195 [Pedobacter sp. MC2016-05]|uniref:hypothetical protein n=1 Tax=Pedobacter sp. MC2016-05 TaxID=2994474 RepID=UPI0022469D1B|nr:hypothetical protein [Pedobacter sp. MC2016-05]MCX2476073.1 hypothetical protein [Pedobacter sp. MC2016-05]